MSHLNSQDIEILIDALDAWIDKDAFANAVNELVEGLMLNTGDSATRGDFERRRKERVLEAAATRETRKRFATLLKAKLYVIEETKWIEPNE